jgi:hypothetical protein
MSGHRVVLVAGSASQAARYAEELGLETGEWVYPSRRGSNLHGLWVSEVHRVGTWYDRKDATEVIQIAERLQLTSPSQVEETSHMTTKGNVDEHMPLYLVNVDPADPGTGYAIIGLVMAQAHKPGRTHLHGSVLSFQYDQERGIGILVRDAGARQHLANSLGLGTPKDVEEFRITSPIPGTGYARNGEIEGIAVKIWNFEA